MAPTVHAMRECARPYCEHDAARLELILDLHAHSTCTNGFIYANMPDDPRAVDAVAAFPRVLGRHSKDFAAAGCKFDTDPSKAGTGRRALSELLPGVHCYTLEISMLGAAQGNVRGDPYLPEHYTEMGRAIGLAFHEHFCTGQAEASAQRATPTTPTHAAHAAHSGGGGGHHAAHSAHAQANGAAALHGGARTCGHARQPRTTAGGRPGVASAGGAPHCSGQHSAAAGATPATAAERAGVPPAVRADVPPATRAGVPPATRAGVAPAVRAGVPPAERAGVPPAERAAVPPAERAAVPPAERAGVTPVERAGVPPAERAATASSALIGVGAAPQGGAAHSPRTTTAARAPSSGEGSVGAPDPRADARALRLLAHSAPPVRARNIAAAPASSGNAAAAIADYGAAMRAAMRAEMRGVVDRGRAAKPKSSAQPQWSRRIIGMPSTAQAHTFATPPAVLPAPAFPVACGARGARSTRARLTAREDAESVPADASPPDHDGT